MSIFLLTLFFTVSAFRCFPLVSLLKTIHQHFHPNNQAKLLIITHNIQHFHTIEPVALGNIKKLGAFLKTFLILAFKEELRVRFKEKYRFLDGLILPNYILPNSGKSFIW